MGDLGLAGPAGRREVAKEFGEQQPLKRTGQGVEVRKRACARLYDTSLRGSEGKRGGKRKGIKARRDVSRKVSGKVWLSAGLTSTVTRSAEETLSRAYRMPLSVISARLDNYVAKSGVCPEPPPPL